VTSPPILGPRVARNAALVLCVVLAAPSGQEATWIAAAPDYEWSFPRDHWSHPGYKTEWWYFTGILTATGSPSRRFGYQFTFFRVGLHPERPALESAWATRDLIMGHAAVTDLSTGRHVFSEVLYRTTPLLGQFGTPGDTTIAWSRAPAGTDARWTLRWNGAAFNFSARDDAKGIRFELETTPRKNLVFQGPNGFSRKGTGPTAASQYYSFTRLETSGTITMGGPAVEVVGESWMDKEFGSNQLDAQQVGWDWFSLRLDDGRDVMIYLLRGSDGQVDYGRATVIDSAGNATYLNVEEWRVDPADLWRSPETGAAYPSRWTVELPNEGLLLDVRPVVPAQENVAKLVPDLFYWEGAVDVRNRQGRSVGEGYVELTGYGTRSRPAI